MWSSRRSHSTRSRKPARALHAAFDPQGDETRAGSDDALRALHRFDELGLATRLDLEECVFGDHQPPSRRARSSGSVAASMAVQASATAPSRTAASADEVTQAAANSRW